MTVTLENAKEQFDALIASVDKGEVVSIERVDALPLQLVAVDPVLLEARRLGFMAGMGSIPEDFDTMFQDEILAMFEGNDGE